MAFLPLILQSLFALSQFPESLRFSFSRKESKNIQEKILRTYLRKNQETLFGKEHGFNEITDIRTYRKKVPIRSYREFLPYIQAIQKGRQQILTAEDVLLLHPTGGTTGTKLIPYTHSLKREFQKALAPWLFDVARNFPDILFGKTYWMITPPGKKPEKAQNQHVQTGFEEDSAYFGWKGQLLFHLFAVPSWITQLHHIENFRFLTLYFLVQEKNLRWLSIWSPTFLLVLLEELERQTELLLSSLYNGFPELPEHEELPCKLKRKPMKARARECEKLLALPEEERYGKIWPSLAFISLWKDAYARYPARRLEALFPRTYFQGKGLLATEGVMSIPLHDASRKGSSGCVPAFTSHFLEFLSDEDRETRCLWELQAGKTYSVILTTGGGFYRYEIGDLVTVEGWYHDLPLLRFIGRKGQFSDLAGEKLEESFVSKCLEKTLISCPLSFSFLLIAPEKWDDTQGYVLFIESSQEKGSILNFSRQLERLLCTNRCYEFAVKMGQITALKVFLVLQEGHRNYVRRCMQSGQKMGDIKPLCFDTRTDWKVVLDGKFL